MSRHPEVRYAIDEDLHFRRLGDETVLLDLGAGRYFHLDEVASEIWQHLAEGDTVGDIRRALVGLYDVAEEKLVRDLEIFLDDVEGKGWAWPVAEMA